MQPHNRATLPTKTLYMLLHIKHDGKEKFLSENVNM